MTDEKTAPAIYIYGRAASPAAYEKRLASAVGEGAMCVTFVHRYLKETA